MLYKNRKDNLSKRPIMKVNVMPSHELTICSQRILQNFTGFYIIHAHDFITLTFCQDYWGWKYHIFLFPLLFFQTWYDSWKTIFLVSSSDFCDRNAFVENLAIRAKVKSRLQPFFGQTKRPMAWKHWFSVKSTKKMASSEK